MSPFRHLLVPNTPFKWTDDLEATFSASKETILEMINKGVDSLDSKLETCLSTDYFNDGMGWILQQKTCMRKKIAPTCFPGGWRLVLAGGALCKPTERNYSPIDNSQELGCKKVHIATNHQPLVTTLGKQSVANVPDKRLARIKEKTMCWRFEMIYNPGKLQSAVDAISRCRPPHMVYVSVDQTKVGDGDEELREFLDLDLEDVHVAINLVNSDKEVNMTLSTKRLRRTGPC
jgi:hypothetical protein